MRQADGSNPTSRRAINSGRAFTSETPTASSWAASSGVPEIVGVGFLVGQTRARLVFLLG